MAGAGRAAAPHGEGEMGRRPGSPVGDGFVFVERARVVGQAKVETLQFISGVIETGSVGFPFRQSAPPPSMIMSRNVRITRLLAMTDSLAATQMQGLRFAGFLPPPAFWQPAVNVYINSDSLEVCMDLAGVRRDEVAVQAEARRLVVRGHRKMPDCGRGDDGCGRLLVMEIPEGSFERVLEFPVEVDPDQVEARQDHGWLLITLPRANQEERP